MTDTGTRWSEVRRVTHMPCEACGGNAYRTRRKGTTVAIRCEGCGEVELVNPVCTELVDHA